MTIAIGGWNEGSKKYSEMAADPERRKRFVESSVAFCKEHNFDGLDLDWEYPGKRGGSPDDKSNFIDLIRDLKEAFNVETFCNDIVSTYHLQSHRKASNNTLVTISRSPD